MVFSVVGKLGIGRYLLNITVAFALLLWFSFLVPPSSTVFLIFLGVSLVVELWALLELVIPISKNSEIRGLLVLRFQLIICTALSIYCSIISDESSTSVLPLILFLFYVDQIRKFPNILMIVITNALYFLGMSLCVVELLKNNSILESESIIIILVMLIATIGIARVFNDLIGIIKKEDICGMDLTYHTISKLYVEKVSEILKSKLKKIPSKKEEMLMLFEDLNIIVNDLLSEESQLNLKHIANNTIIKGRKVILTGWESKSNIDCCSPIIVQALVVYFLDLIERYSTEENRSGEEGAWITLMPGKVTIRDDNWSIPFCNLEEEDLVTLKIITTKCFQKAFSAHVEIGESTWFELNNKGLQISITFFKEK